MRKLLLASAALLSLASTICSAQTIVGWDFSVDDRLSTSPLSYIADASLTADGVIGVNGYNGTNDLALEVRYCGQESNYAYFDFQSPTAGYVDEVYFSYIGNNNTTGEYVIELQAKAGSGSVTTGWAATATPDTTAGISGHTTGTITLSFDTPYSLAANTTYSFRLVPIWAGQPARNTGTDFLQINAMQISGAVPEPSSYAAIAGILALGLVVARRRK